MKCPNCGHENEANASFCEECGTNLRETLNKGISTTNKVLIGVVIVLVLGIGLISGMLLVNNQPTTANNTTSANNSTVENSTTPVTSDDTKSGNDSNTSTSKSKDITASEAKDIAAGYTGFTPTGAVYYNENYNYYQVILEVPGEYYTTYVFVDAETGSIVEWQNGQPVKIT